MMAIFDGQGNESKDGIVLVLVDVELRVVEVGRGMGDLCKEGAVQHRGVVLDEQLAVSQSL